MAETSSDAERIIRDWKNAIEGDPSNLDEIVSESFVWQTPAAPGGEVRGPDAAKDVIREVTGAFPDFEAEFVDMLVGDDTGMAEVRFEMTHENEYGGIPPTGRRVELGAMSAWRVEDGELQELRDYANMQELFEQLGVTEE